VLPGNRYAEHRFNEVEKLSHPTFVRSALLLYLPWRSALKARDDTRLRSSMLDRGDPLMTTFIRCSDHITSKARVQTRKTPQLVNLQSYRGPFLSVDSFRGLLDHLCNCSCLRYINGVAALYLCHP